MVAFHNLSHIVAAIMVENHSAIRILFSGQH